MKLTRSFVLMVLALVFSLSITTITGIFALGYLQGAVQSLVQVDVQRFSNITTERKRFRSLVLAEKECIGEANRQAREAMIAKIRELRGQLEDAMKTYETRFVSAQDAATFDKLQQARKDWFALNDRVLAALDVDVRQAETLAKQHSDEWESLIAQIVSTSESRVQAQAVVTTNIYHFAFITLFAISAIAALFALLSGRNLFFKIRQNMNDVIEVNTHLEALVAERTAALRERTEELVHASREAGKAEIATSVLHNVGNALNTVNMSATLVADTVENSSHVEVQRIADLLAEKAADLPTFFSAEPGTLLPEYIGKVARVLDQERSSVLEEVHAMMTGIDHIKAIVRAQQAFAKMSSNVMEAVTLDELVGDALQLSGAALARHRVKVHSDFDGQLKVVVDRHKAIQILVNLITNAKEALNGLDQNARDLTIRAALDGATHVTIEVSDNGEGIATENLDKIFSYGFTTKSTGHGFGLHNAAVAAVELGGGLTVTSDGPGKGASFRLRVRRPGAEVGEGAA